MKKWTITDNKNYMTVVFADNIFRHKYLYVRKNFEVYMEEVPLKEVFKVYRSILLNIIYAPVTLYNYYYRPEEAIISVDETKIKRFYMDHRFIKPTYVFK